MRNASLKSLSCSAPLILSLLVAQSLLARASTPTLPPDTLVSSSSENLKDKGAGRVSVVPGDLNELHAPGLPRFQIYKDPALEGCLKDEGNTNTGGYLENPSKWVLTCDLESFRKKVRVAIKKNYALRFLAAKILRSETAKLRNNLLAKNGNETPPLDSPFYKQSEELIKESQFLLKPMYTDPKGAQGVLALEAVYETFLIFGEGLRFPQIRTLLKEQNNLLMSRRSLQNEIIHRVVEWVEISKHPALQEWVLEKLVSLRPTEVTGSGDQELYSWTRSLLLSPLPKDKDAKEFTLRKLRELWIAFPDPNDAKQIRDVADRLDLSLVFLPPTTKDMNVDELLIRAKAQVRSLDTLGALRTMRRIRGLPPKSVSVNELWDGLQFHVKVLRLLDERSQIPAVIQSYLGAGHFLDTPTQPSEMPKFLNRAYELARLYWNYDTPEKANEVLDKIVATNLAAKTEYSLGPSLVIKARIAEQARDRDRAIPLIDQALSSRISQELVIDLLWRKIFLQLDTATTSGNFASVLPYFEPLKRISDKDPVERGRWHYWIAQVLILANRNADAVVHLNEAYKSDSFSYYSNLAGLELVKQGKTPDDWLFAKKDEAPASYENRPWKTPNWELYFTDFGKVREPVFRELARVYYLASIGDTTLAERAFFDLDKTVWQRALSSKIPWIKRRDFVRAVAWVRTALKDPMGSLRAAEIARQANGKGFEKEDHLNLYPLPFWDNIKAQASLRGINPWLVASLVRQESAFNTRARSWANAIGLMQMIPPVAIEEAKVLGLQEFKPEDLYEPPMALQLGISHLSRLLKSFENSWICSIAAYNAGSPPVAKWIGFYVNQYPTSFIERIPFLETRNYVKSILRNFMNYHRIYGDADIDMAAMMQMPKVVPGTLITRPPTPPEN